MTRLGFWSPMDSDKRDAILEAARAMFSRLGFRKTSIDEVAQKAQVGKGTVYLAAESKEDLFYQVVEREIRRWQAEMSATIDPKRPAEETLRALAIRAEHHMNSHPLVRDLLCGEMRKVLPRWADRFDQLSAAGRQNIIEVLRIGIAQGRFRDDLDLPWVASVLQDLHIASLLLHPGESDVARMKRAQVGLDLILHGLRISERASS